jgi:hypothetical protein
MEPFSLTYVRYPAGSLVGFLSAGLSLAPIFIIVMCVRRRPRGGGRAPVLRGSLTRCASLGLRYTTLLASRRDLHTGALLAGQVRAGPGCGGDSSLSGEVGHREQAT